VYFVVVVGQSGGGLAALPHLIGEMAQFLAEQGQMNLSTRARRGAGTTVAAEAGHLFESSLAMSRALLQTRDLEQIRLAAAIHDDPLQRLSLVAAALDHLAHTDVIQEAQLQEMRCHQCQELLCVAEQLRTLCSELRPPILAQGIQWAVKEVVYDVQRVSSLDVQLAVAVPATCQISTPVSRAIYHVLVEALNNVRKHAQATTA
jgi:signal transduction histidine kinase